MDQVVSTILPDPFIIFQRPNSPRIALGLFAVRNTESTQITVLYPAFAVVGLWLVITTSSYDEQLLFRIVQRKVLFPGASPLTWFPAKNPAPPITLHSPLPIEGVL